MSKTGASVGGGCGGSVLLLILCNAILGEISVRYLVSELLHQSISWPIAIIIGLIAGEITVPLMVVVWLLRLAGIAV